MKPKGTRRSKRGQADLPRPNGKDSRLQKKAKQSGIPMFAWRLAMARKMSLTDCKTTVRYRRD